MTDYKAMEVEADNLRLQDALMNQMKSRIEDLERENKLLNKFLKIQDEHLAEPQVPDGLPKELPRRPHYRTMTEIQIALEDRSRRAALKGGKVKSAEDIIADDTD